MGQAPAPIVRARSASTPKPASHATGAARALPTVMGIIHLFHPSDWPTQFLHTGHCITPTTSPVTPPLMTPCTPSVDLKKSVWSMAEESRRLLSKPPRVYPAVVATTH